MLMRIAGVGSVIAFATLLILINTSTPSEIGPLGILAVFFCLYIALCGALMITIWGGQRLVTRLLRPLFVRRPVVLMSAHKAYYFASVIALAPVMLLGMQSVSGVDIYGVTLVGVFVVIGCIYIAKRAA